MMILRPSSGFLFCVSTNIRTWIGAGTVRVETGSEDISALSVNDLPSWRIPHWLVTLSPSQWGNWLWRQWRTRVPRGSWRDASPSLCPTRSCRHQGSAGCCSGTEQPLVQIRCCWIHLNLRRWARLRFYPNFCPPVLHLLPASPSPPFVRTRPLQDRGLVQLRFDYLWAYQRYLSLHQRCFVNWTWRWRRQHRCLWCCPDGHRSLAGGPQPAS